MALRKQTIPISISQGLDTKTDDKQVSVGKALALENVRFQKTGKLSKRYGQMAVNPSIRGGGSLTDLQINHIASDELQLNTLTDDGIYQLGFNDQEWIKTSDFKYPALVQSELVTKTSVDNIKSDCDYDSTFNYVATVAIGTIIGGSTTPYLVLTLKNLTNETIKTIRLNNIDLFDPAPRVILTNNGTGLRLFVFYAQSPNIVYHVYNENLEEVVAQTIVVATPSICQIDCVKDSSSVFLLLKESTNLTAYKYSIAGSLVTSNTVTGTALATKASQPLGFSCDLNGDTIHCAWPSNTGGGDFTVVGVSKTTLAITNPQVIFTPTTPTAQIAIVSDSQNVYVATSIKTTLSSVDYFSTVIYIIDYTSGYTITGGSGAGRLLILSKPYILNGNVYFPLMCAEPEQLCGLIVDQNGKEVTQFSPFQIAPAVLDTISTLQTFMVSKSSPASDKALFCFEKSTTQLQSADIGETIATRGTSLLTFSIPENYLTGTRSKIGESVYITNGLTIELDGRAPHDNGFSLGPKIYGTGATTGGSLPTGNYNYKAVYEFYDAFGQRTISQESNAITVNIASGTAGLVTITYFEPVATYKGSTTTINENIRSNIVLYRTEVGGSVYYRVKALEVGSIGGPGSTTDSLSDSSLRNNATLYTTGGVFENIPAPVGSSSFSGGNRLFIVGLEEKDEIAYSKKQLFGESVNFAPNFRIRVSSASSLDKTPLRCGAYLDGKIIIFREESIYFSTGDGPNEVGVGEFSDPEPISTDVGCIEPRSVVNSPLGVFFKSRKGIYLLNRSLQVSYVGAEVEYYNSENICASILANKYNEIRFYTTSGKALVYNYLFGVWSVFNEQTDSDADVWKGEVALTRLNAPYVEDSSVFKNDSSYYSMKFTSPWLNLGLIQGYQRCYQLWIIGDFKSAHTLKCKIYTDFDDSTFEEYDLVYNNSESPQYQFQISLPNQKVESMKFEIYDTDQSGTGESFDLSNLQVEVGLKAGGYKLASTKSY